MTTARIAPAPVSAGAIGLDERQPRSRQEKRADFREKEASKRLHALKKKTRIQPRAFDENASLPAETLFAATLFANGMRENGMNAHVPMRRMEWAPPDSGLRLKDKTI